MKKLIAILIVLNLLTGCSMAILGLRSAAAVHDALCTPERVDEACVELKADQCLVLRVICELPAAEITRAQADILEEYIEELETP